MDKIERVGPPEAVGVSDGLYSFEVKLNEPPAAHWIYVFRIVANPSKGEIDSDRVVFDRERGLLFASEEPLVPEWIRYIDLWITEANAQVAADEAAAEKRRAETEARDRRDALLKQVNEKYKNL
jgi:hypothetical protein